MIGQGRSGKFKKIKIFFARFTNEMVSDVGQVKVFYVKES